MQKRLLFRQYTLVWFLLEIPNIAISFYIVRKL